MKTIVNKTLCSSALLAAVSTFGLASGANADVKILLPNQSLAGGESASYDTSGLTGTLTGFSIVFDFDDLASGATASWASDMGIVFDGGVQYGGLSNVFGTSAGPYWSFDGSGSTNPGTYTDTIGGLSTAFTGQTLNILIGNTWLTSLTCEYNNVSITLIGVDKVPAPGALALLGVAGLAGRRRRRSS